MGDDASRPLSRAGRWLMTIMCGAAGAAVVGAFLKFIEARQAEARLDVVRAELRGAERMRDVYIREPDVQDHAQSYDLEYAKREESFDRCVDRWVARQKREIGWYNAARLCSGHRVDHDPTHADFYDPGFSEVPLEGWLDPTGWWGGE